MMFLSHFSRSTPCMQIMHTKANFDYFDSMHLIVLQIITSHDAHRTQQEQFTLFLFSTQVLKYSRKTLWKSSAFPSSSSFLSFYVTVFHEKYIIWNSFPCFSLSSVMLARFICYWKNFIADDFFTMSNSG